MLFNLLTEVLPEGGRFVGVGEAALYALIGFLVVFAGISFLIFVVWLVGKFITKTSVRKAKTCDTVKQAQTQSPVSTQISPALQSLPIAGLDEVSEETIAVITAALMAYYQQNKPKCEFTVKRIKRI